MLIALIAVCFVSSAGIAWGQALPENKNADIPESSTGRTITPETKGQLQPQGWTGPTNTKSGGAPASSPQGDTPAGMQAAPDGSSKTAVEPDKK